MTLKSSSLLTPARRIGVAFVAIPGLAAALAFGLRAAPVAAAAPETAAPPAAFGSSVEVNLVNVEAFVTDADGRPVEDLVATDFRLLEDGRPVAIEYFAPPAAGGVAARPAGAQAGAAGEPASPLRLVLFVDEANPGSSNRQPTFLALKKDLVDQLPAGSQVMVMLFEQGPHVVLPFTADRRKIAETLDAVSLHMSPRRLIGDRDRTETLEAIHRDATESGLCLYGDMIARSYADNQRQVALETIAAMSRLVGSLDGLSGRKALVYVGDGVPMRPGEEAFETYIALCAGEGVALGIAGAQDTATYGNAHFDRPDPQKVRLEYMNYDTSQRWQALAARASDSGVTLFALAAGGPTRLDRVSAEDSQRKTSLTATLNAERGRIETLQLATEETGGRLAYAGGGLDQALARWRADLTRYYLLGFTPSEPGNLHVRHLKVEVARAGLTVRHRQSYALRSTEERITDRLLSRLLYGAGDNRLGARLASAQAPATPAAAGTRERGDEGSVRLRLLIPISRLTLLPEAGRWSGLFTAYMLARDERNAMTPVLRKTIAVVYTDDEIEAARGRDFVWEVEIPLASGPHDVAVAVRDELSGEASYLGQRVTVGR